MRTRIVVTTVCVALAFCAASTLLTRGSPRVRSARTNAGTCKATPNPWSATLAPTRAAKRIPAGP